MIKHYIGLVPTITNYYGTFIPRIKTQEELTAFWKENDQPLGSLWKSKYSQQELEDYNVYILVDKQYDIEDAKFSYNGEVKAFCYMPIAINSTFLRWEELGEMLCLSEEETRKVMEKYAHISNKIKQYRKKEYLD